jgi:hypothetical protein
MFISKTIDGKAFWNPYEGLAVGANLMKLMRDWLESGRVTSANGTKQEACKTLASLERQSRAVRPLVKEAMHEWYKAKTGKQMSARPIKVRHSDGQALAKLREQLSLVKTQFTESNGSLRLEDLAISYPAKGVEIKFTAESYFDFALRSADEVLEMANSGLLAGPADGQVF